MNYEDVQARYMADLNTISSTTTYSLEEVNNEIARVSSVGGGGGNWDWSNSAQPVTINTNATIDKDLWDRLTTNTIRSIDIEPVSIRGVWGECIIFDDSMWRKGFTFTFEEAAPFEEDVPLEQIPDGDLEDIL